MPEHSDSQEQGQKEYLKPINVGLAARMAMYALRGDGDENSYGIKFRDVHRPSHLYEIGLVTTEEGMTFDQFAYCPKDFKLPVIGLNNWDYERDQLQATPYGSQPTYVYAQDGNLYSFENTYFFTLDGKATKCCIIQYIEDPENTVAEEELKRTPKFVLYQA